MANKNYDANLKVKILRLHLGEGLTKKSLTEEFNLGQAHSIIGLINTEKNMN